MSGLRCEALNTRIPAPRNNFKRISKVSQVGSQRILLQSNVDTTAGFYAFTLWASSLAPAARHHARKISTLF